MSLDKLLKDYQSCSRSDEARRMLDNPLLQKDVWRTIEDLGLSIKEHQRCLTLNFTVFSQDWFKLLVKLYTLVRKSSGKTVSTIQQDIFNLKKFSVFLDQQSVYDPDQINDQIFEAFDYYSKTKDLKERTISITYIALVSFFDTCRLEGWLNVNTYWFKGKRSIGTHTNEVEYIPEEVWNQLDQNLYHLPESLQRMILIIRSTGMRAGELLNLPFDCLRKRRNQWRLRFKTEKYNVEDELPITVELAAIIKEQQEYIRQYFGQNLSRFQTSNPDSAVGLIFSSKSGVELTLKK